MITNNLQWCVALNGISLEKVKVITHNSQPSLFKYYRIFAKSLTKNYCQHMPAELATNNQQSFLAEETVSSEDRVLSEEAVLLKIAINVPLRRTFEYLLPENYPVTPVTGMRVEVPFGRTSKIGIIHSVHQLSQKSAEIDFHQLKTINRIIDEGSLLTSALIALYHWMLNYYHAPHGEVWQTMLPSDLIKGKPAELARESYWHITAAGKNALKNNEIKKTAVKQRQILSCLNELPAGLAHEQLSSFDFSYAQLKNLAGKKWVMRDYLSYDEHQSMSSQLSQIPKDIRLNSEQQTAIDKVANALGSYQSFLLFGVTASGKTEVYLRLIQQVIEQGKQALVLVPEIGLTPQTLKRFEQRFQVEIVLLHSGMSEAQRLQSWLKAKQGSAKIIIGTRSALFVPLKFPGLIVIDEEHDLSFRQQQGFRYSARDIAMVRASIENIPVLLGSASPSLESLNNVRKHKMTLLSLKQKAKSAAALSYRIIDLKNQPMNQGLSYDLIQSIKQHLNQQGQVLLFLNRRGYAPVLLCHECGFCHHCERCDIHFTYHHANQYLQCHHCGSNRRAPTQCPQCSCQQMVPVGIGTERLQSTIEQLFPSAKVARIDRDTTRQKSAMKDFVDSIKAGDVDILIGTQMLAKGHHFPDVTLVALIDMDGALYSADFRAPEYAAQLITQVSGRAGRADKKGEVIIQTHLSEHSMLKQIIFDGYEAFAEAAILERIEAELPPHTFSAMFIAESPQLEQVKNFLQQVKQVLDRYSNLKVELLGPAPAVYAKKAGKFRYQLFLQTDSRNQLHQLLELTLPDIEKLSGASRVRWRLEIDPVGGN